MKRIFPDYTYGSGPRDGCWWDDTIAAPDWPRLSGSLDVDAAIIGGGYTGLSAALRLAEQGTRVAVIEAGPPGWGASGRNGGFCCMGGALHDKGGLTRRFGEDDAALFEQAQLASIDLVANFLRTHKVDADVHSRGETVMAHTARAARVLQRQADQTANSDMPGEWIAGPDLNDAGLNGTFHGALTWPKGFALNPRKYLFRLSKAASDAGALIFAQSPVQSITRHEGRSILHAPGADVRADAVLICTNGYSSEDLPQDLAGAYMPAQSSVLVTRPLTEAELAAQGWTSNQMAYDTRNLLHYFRLMPDRRFLFGTRGGLLSSPGSERMVRARARRHFHRMFPAWTNVPVTHEWSGMVCLSRRGTPFVGALPGAPGQFAALAFHGNGVAMGSYCGRILADTVLGRTPDLPVPKFLSAPMARFPFGSLRRVVMPPAYLALSLKDM